MRYISDKRIIGGLAVSNKRLSLEADLIEQNEVATMTDYVVKASLSYETWADATVIS